ncbi:unnamed protein product [Closterium sp. Naga37s-1]|nr:unnamed protein product [Closterium sp. Naga37s-1]
MRESRNYPDDRLESRHLRATIIQAVSRFVISSSRVKPSQLPLLVAAFFISPTPAVPNPCHAQSSLSSPSVPATASSPAASPAAAVASATVAAPPLSSAPCPTPADALIALLLAEQATSSRSGGGCTEVECSAAGCAADAECGVECIRVLTRPPASTKEAKLQHCLVPLLLHIASRLVTATASPSHLHSPTPPNTNAHAHHYHPTTLQPQHLSSTRTAAIQASPPSQSEKAAAAAAAAEAGELAAAREGTAAVGGEGGAAKAEGMAAATEEGRATTTEGKVAGEKGSNKGGAPGYMSTREACALLSSLSSSLLETDVALLSACLPVLLLLPLHQSIPTSLNPNERSNVPLNERLNAPGFTPQRHRQQKQQQKEQQQRVEQEKQRVQNPAAPSLLRPRAPLLTSPQPTEAVPLTMEAAVSLPSQPRLLPAQRSLPPVVPSVRQLERANRSRGKGKVQPGRADWDAFTVPDGVADRLPVPEKGPPSSSARGARKVLEAPQDAFTVPDGVAERISERVPPSSSAHAARKSSEAPQDAFAVPDGVADRVSVSKPEGVPPSSSAGARKSFEPPQGAFTVPDGLPVGISEGVPPPSSALMARKRRKLAADASQVPSVSCAVPSGGFQVPSGGFQVPSGGFQVPSGGFQVPSGGFQVPSGALEAHFASSAPQVRSDTSGAFQPLEHMFLLSSSSKMSCGADGEDRGGLDRRRGGGSSSGGGEDGNSNGGSDNSGSELLSQEGKRSWVQWCLPPPRDDYRDKEFIQVGALCVCVHACRQIERGPLALQQAFIQILSADPTALRTGGLDVRFTGEGGAAGPGVLREFFAFVRAHLFDPNLGLFSPIPHDPSRFSLSLASRANPAEAKEYLRFAGRILALALAHQVPLGVKLSRSLFALLAARTPSLADAADDDPQLVASCRSLLAMAKQEREEAAQGGGREEGGVESLCLTFVASVEDPMGGAPIEAELVPGGSERVVRADDVSEFVQRLVQFRVCGVVEEEGEALRRGMEDILGSGGGRDVVLEEGDVVEGREGTDGKGGMDGSVRGQGGLEGGFGRGDMEGGDGLQTAIQKSDDCCIDSVEGVSLAAMLAPLSCDDLNFLLHGEDRHVAVSDWQAHTVYHGYSPEDPQVLWFWEVVESLSGEQRKSLLFFATAVSNLPVNGFRGLAMGFHLHRAVVDLSRLPTAHTCFHQFLLPPYESIETMRTRLLTLNRILDSSLSPYYGIRLHHTTFAITMAAAAGSFVFSPALRLAFVLLLVSSALRPAESEWIGESGGPRKSVALTRPAHAQLLLRRQQQQQQQQRQRPATTVVRGGPGGDAIVSAVGFPLVRSAASDGFSASDGLSASDGFSASDGAFHGATTTTAATPADNVTINWGAGSGKEAFVQALSSDSGSQGGAGDASVKGWWAITAAYYQSGADGKKNISSKVRLAGTVIDNYSRGKNPSDSDVHAIVKSPVGPGKPFALDPHGIYVLFTSADVILGVSASIPAAGTPKTRSTPSLCASPFVGHHGQCPNSCGVRGMSPNGNPAIDATITTLAHEITETATSPEVGTGWFVDEGGENGDKCSWNFGSTKTGSLQNGQSYEYSLVGLNGRRFLVQQNWDRVLNKCVLQNALPSQDGSGGGTPSPSPPPSPSPRPPSPSPPLPSPSPRPPSPSPPPPPPSPSPPPPAGGSVKMNCDCNCASASNPMSCQCTCTKTG